jgi:hypothetical protein
MYWIMLGTRGIMGRRRVWRGRFYHKMLAVVCGNAFLPKMGQFLSVHYISYYTTQLAHQLPKRGTIICLLVCLWINRPAFPSALEMDYSILIIIGTVHYLNTFIPSQQLHWARYYSQHSYHRFAHGIPISSRARSSFRNGIFPISNWTVIILGIIRGAKPLALSELEGRGGIGQRIEVQGYRFGMLVSFLAFLVLLFNSGGMSGMVCAKARRRDAGELGNAIMRTECGNGYSDWRTMGKF